MTLHISVFFSVIQKVHIKKKKVDGHLLKYISMQTKGFKTISSNSNLKKKPSKSHYHTIKQKSSPSTGLFFT